MEALRLIESGAASVLIATRIDHIGRSARVILDIVDRVKKAGGELVMGDVKFDNRGVLTKRKNNTLRLLPLFLTLLPLSWSSGQKR